MPTISVENYLKAIYHLERRTDGLVKTSAIAERLEISLPSVTSMLKSLSDEGWVAYTRYKGVALTDEGRRQALKVIRKHRLVELFLVTTLGYDWDEVHAEAERLEHAISDELAARIERFLSYPAFDPHGDPIPTVDGQIVERETVALSMVDVGEVVRLDRVLDQDPDVLRYLTRVGLTISKVFQVTEVLPFDGQMFLSLDDTESISVSQSLATRLMVSRMH